MNKETYDIFFFWVLTWENEVIFFFAENAKLLSFGHCNTYFLCSKQSKRLYICKCRKCVTVLLNSTLIHSISSKERERNKNIILRKFPGFNQVECIFPVETVISCDMKWIFSSREFPELSNKNISNFVLEHFLKL